MDAHDRLRSWLAAQADGVGFHTDVYYDKEIAGIKAKQALGANTTVVSMPFSAAITPDVSKKAILSLVNQVNTNIFDGLSERQLIVLYIALHWITGLVQLEGLESTIDYTGDLSHFAHAAYINTLPSPSSLRTPLHFTLHELVAFKGTNLFGATLDRQHAWEAEHAQCAAFLFTHLGADWSARLTWTLYLTAATHLSSRAFPSTVLSSTPSLAPSPSSYPVLLPGIDALNHKRAHPVSWVVDTARTDAAPRISLQVHTPTPAGEEVYNNYGAKPNAELILGYGFALEANAEDTCVFRVGGGGGGGGGGPAGAAHEVGLDAKNASAVYDEVLQRLRHAHSTQNGQDVDPAAEWEDELDAADALGEMVEHALQRLPSIRDDDNEIRAEVHSMLVHYVEGQRAILESMLKFASTKRHEVIVAAQAAGVHFEEVDEGEGESEAEVCGTDDSKQR